MIGTLAGREKKVYVPLLNSNFETLLSAIVKFLFSCVEYLCLTKMFSRYTSRFVTQGKMMVSPCPVTRGITGGRESICRVCLRPLSWDSTADRRRSYATLSCIGGSGLCQAKSPVADTWSARAYICRLRRAAR